MRKDGKSWWSVSPTHVCTYSIYITCAPVVRLGGLAPAHPIIHTCPSAVYIRKRGGCGAFVEVGILYQSKVMYSGSSLSYKPFIVHHMF